MTTGGLGGLQEPVGRNPPALHGQRLPIPSRKTWLLPCIDPEGSRPGQRATKNPGTPPPHPAITPLPPPTGAGLSVGALGWSSPSPPVSASLGQ